MSVWHEVQLEFARDTLDALIEAHGKTPQFVRIMDIIKEAETVGTDIPEDDDAEAIRRLEQSNALLTQAENKFPATDGKLFRDVRKKLKHAKEANEMTIKEIRKAK